MKVAVLLVLIAVLAVVSSLRNPRSWRARLEEDELADFKFKDFLKKAGKVAVDVGKAYVNKRYGLALDEEEEEEADLKFKDVFKKVGKVALDVGKSYLRSKYNLPLEDEESDGPFWEKIKGWWQNKGQNLLSKGLQIYSAVKNNQNSPSDDEDDLADFKIGKFLGKIGKGALNIGKAYLQAKTGVALDDEDFDAEADAMFGKRIAKWWNEKGKDLAIKGLQIYSAIKNNQQGDAADEESDAEFLEKLKNWWNNKGENLFKKGLEVYSAVKSAKQQQGDDVDEESSDRRIRDTLRNLDNAVELLSKLKEADEAESDSEFLEGLKNAITKVKDWLKEKFTKKPAEPAKEETQPAAQG